ncbi:MAG: methylated-DNA--[protein]-cysteine S-methyltransferase [Bacteroidota bacterium]
MQIKDQATIDRYYEALLQRDSAYTGIFFVGVKTTSVFCIATCRARKPKKENVVFYTTFKEALDHGYRPCKVCRPTQHATEAPAPVSRALDLVRSHPKEKISDRRLREEGIRPEQVRRWFNKHYGMTFQAYQRMYRINQAFKELKEGKSTTHAAFDSGYQSLSGFGYTYKSLFGKAPSQAGALPVILISRTTTPLGPMFICATDKGVCLLEFTDRKMLETEFEDLQRRLGARILTGENAHMRQAKQELANYFQGNRKQFSVPLDMPGTEFQQMVWNQLQQVPFGETSTYGAQAVQLGRPDASRAVARANGSNRIAIITPCHRIIGADGSLRGYGGGLERKRWLLEHEQQVCTSF